MIFPFGHHYCRPQSEFPLSHVTSEKAFTQMIENVF